MVRAGIKAAPKNCDIEMSVLQTYDLSRRRIYEFLTLREGKFVNHITVPGKTGPWFNFVKKK